MEYLSEPERYEDGAIPKDLPKEIVNFIQLAQQFVENPKEAI